MKKLVSVVLLSLLAAAGFAGKYKPTTDDVNTFLKNITYVVMEGNPMSAYNMKMKEIMEKNWTVTKFEYISASQFEQMRKERDKSFLVLVAFKFPDENVSINYTHLCALNGSATSKVTDMPEVIGVPMAYAKADEASFVYKVEGVVRFMQQHILAMKANPAILKNDMLEPYSDNAPKIKEKELWLTEKDLTKELRDITVQRKYYPFPLKVVTPEDIEQAIADGNDNVLFVHKVGPEGQRMQERVYKMVFGAKDGMLYYYDMHRISGSKTDGLLESDLKKMAKK